MTNTRRRDWWAPPPDDLSRTLAFRGMPPTLLGFVLRASAWSQVWISLLAIGVFVLNTVPLELQRRILNATVVNGDIRMILGLVVASLVRETFHYRHLWILLALVVTYERTLAARTPANPTVVS